jgi:hypothetical protein
MMAAAGELWRRVLYLWRPPRGGFHLSERGEIGSRMGEEEGDEQDDGLESMAMEVLRLISHSSEAGMAAICGSAFRENMPHPWFGINHFWLGFRIFGIGLSARSSSPIGSIPILARLDDVTSL